MKKYFLVGVILTATECYLARDIICKHAEHSISSVILFLFESIVFWPYRLYDLIKSIIRKLIEKHSTLEEK